MSLKEALEEIISDEDKILELNPMVTFRKLSEEDQNALRLFFQRWAETAKKHSQAISSSSLIALGFILGHNWVKEHWALW